MDGCKRPCLLCNINQKTSLTVLLVLFSTEVNEIAAVVGVQTGKNLAYCLLF